jgi:RNA polymerase sigma-70 factor (ECF subfamily)
MPQPQNAKAWLLTIVSNTSMTWLKRNRSAGATIGFKGALDDPGERLPDPEEIMLISCDHEEVRQALEQLSWDFREAIVLREMEGPPYRENSAAVGVPLGTVMSRLLRGRDWLRHILSTPKSTSKPIKPKEGAGLR